MAISITSARRTTTYTEVDMMQLRYSSYLNSTDLVIVFIPFQIIIKNIICLWEQGVDGKWTEGCKGFGKRLINLHAFVII